MSDYKFQRIAEDNFSLQQSIGDLQARLIKINDRLDWVEKILKAQGLFK